MVREMIGKVGELCAQFDGKMNLEIVNGCQLDTQSKLDFSSSFLQSELFEKSCAKKKIDFLLFACDEASLQAKRKKNARYTLFVLRLRRSFFTGEEQKKSLFSQNFIRIIRIEGR